MGLPLLSGLAAPLLAKPGALGRVFHRYSLLKRVVFLRPDLESAFSTRTFVFGVRSGRYLSIIGLFLAVPFLPILPPVYPRFPLLTGMLLKKATWDVGACMGAG